MRKFDYNGDESYIYVNKAEICKTKDNIICYKFCLGSLSSDFSKEEQSEIFLNGIAYHFSVGHSSIKKDILNIY